MAIFLDSADVQDAERAARIGFVTGITTNPKLLAGTDPLERIPELIDAFPSGPICCQLTDLTSTDSALKQAETFAELGPGQVVIKVPTRTETVSLASELIERGVKCAMTAIFSPEQALLAGEIGAAWVIPYVDRTTRLGGDGMVLVSQMRSVLDTIGAPTRVMAASIKVASEVAQIFEAGAHDITAGMPLLLDLGNHQWSEESITDFAAASDGSSR